jgi:hypothetical protein
MGKVSRQSRRSSAPPEPDQVAAPAATPGAREVARDVLLPFAISRLLLLIVARLGWLLPFPGTWIPEFARRGWGFSPTRSLDMWARWDSGWYLDIALNGYSAGNYLQGQYSTIAFFPLYPQALRVLHAILPSSWQGPQAALVIGLVVSNLCALGALTLLYRHVWERFGGSDPACKSVVLALTFPTGFFLSCAYSESLFLLLALATFHLAWKQRWAWAAVAGGLAATTRPSGVLLVLPLAWFIHQAEPRRLTRFAWLLLVPVGFLGFAAYLWHLTGDPWAVFHAQTAWHRGFSSPFALLGEPPTKYGPMVHLDRALTLGFLALCAWLLSRREWRADGLVILACLVSYMFTGTPLSASRFLLAAFPFFVWMARHSRQGLRTTVLLSGLAIQVILWVLWTHMAWVG